MKHFIIKVGIFTGLLIAILIVLKLLVSPFWGNPLIEAKVRHLNSLDIPINTLFVGSSKTYRHIDPVLFDQMTGLSSYNLGSSSMFYSESQYVLQEYLKLYNQDNQVIKVFLQDRAPKEIGDQNLHSIRSKYFMNWDQWTQGSRKFWNARAYGQVYNYTISYAENLLCIGEVQGMITNILGLDKVVLSEFEQAHRGYYPLDLQILENPTEGILERERLFKRQAKKRREIPERAKMLKLVAAETSPMDDIQFYYASHVILESEFHFDRTHLNADGARIYTRKLANAYNN